MNKKGFTLLETILAMVILSSGIVLLANSWGGSFMRVKKTQFSTEIAALLERKMTEIEIKYTGKPLDSIPEEEGDDFGSEYKDYAWKMTSKELEIPDLSATLQAKKGEAGVDEKQIMIMKLFTQHIQKVVKEVKVSVIYKGTKKKPLEFSATQYFVDFDKQIDTSNIPGMPAGMPGGGNAGGNSTGNANGGATGASK